MDDRGFDDLTRTLATGRSRRAVLKGLLGVGGAAVATAVTRAGTDAAWSTLICLPAGQGGYTQRLVPTAAVAFYVARYGAVLPENGGCPCLPLTVAEACGTQCGGTADRGCGEVATCGFGDCEGPSFCVSQLSDGRYFCMASHSCTDGNEPCSDVLPCASGHCDPEAGVCVRCLSDADCLGAFGLTICVDGFENGVCTLGRACVLDV